MTHVDTKRNQSVALSTPVAWACFSARPSSLYFCTSWMNQWLFVLIYNSISPKRALGSLQNWLIAIGKIESGAKVRFYLEETFTAESKTVDGCQEWTKNCLGRLMNARCMLSKPCKGKGALKATEHRRLHQPRPCVTGNAGSFEDKGHPCHKTHNASLCIEIPPYPSRN